MNINDLPKYHELFLPTLKALDSLGGSASLDESDQAVLEILNLPDALIDIQYPSGNGAILPDRMSWARSYLKGAGYLESGGRGVWVLTDEGREAQKLSPSKLKQDVLLKTKPDKKHSHQIPIFSEENGITDFSADNPDDAISDWRDQLLNKLKEMDPSAFERLVQRLLRESNFVKVEVTGKSGDGGIDGTGILQLSLLSFHVLFQCKRYQGSVGAGAVRDFRGAMVGRTDKGLIITTGTFTLDARREATRDGAPAIDLIDGEALCEKLKDLGLGVKKEMVERITVLPKWFDEI